ncbi:MAG TPA: SURF1 family protein [Kineosporiaceae bacterium]
MTSAGAPPGSSRPPQGPPADLPGDVGGRTDPGRAARPAPDDGRPAPARVDPVTIRATLTVLRERFWLRLAVAVVLLSVAFFFLGRWQLGRHEAKVARNDRINANYSAAPIPLPAVLPAPDTPLPVDREWTQVRLTGSYESDRQRLIRNRPVNGDFGYEVLVPLRLPSGSTFLVDRGWLPPGEDFVRPDTVPAPPSGQVSVVVRLRPGEPPLDRTPPPGQELRIDLGRLATVAGGTVYRGAYGVLASENPAPATAPTLLPRPDEDLGPHLAYAVQWWIGDVAAYVLLGYYLVAEVRRRHERPAPTGSAAVPVGRRQPPGPAGPDEPVTPGGTDGQLDAAARPDAETPRGPDRPRRRRRRPRLPSDEEWEDALSR